MASRFRKGAVGAMMDEYTRAAGQLSELLLKISDAEFERVRDLQSPDENCRSIQTIMRHVVRAGYGYAGSIRGAFGAEAKAQDVPLRMRLEALDQLEAMLEYTVETLEGKWELSEDEITAVRIHSRWGVIYDLEQLLEHAIVHVLRHRRQIERFLTEPQFSGGAAL
jgi:uncharacterized damage-inducible protein DinB